jgi:hypothetical protein
MESRAHGPLASSVRESQRLPVLRQTQAGNVNSCDDTGHAKLPAPVHHTLGQLFKNAP